MARSQPRSRGWGFDPTPIVWVASALLLVILIVGPMYFLVQESLLLPKDEGGGWSLGNYVKAYTTPLYRGPVVWTLIISVSVSLISLVVGSAMAWAVARTDMPLPGLIRTTVLASFVTPPFLGATAWVFLAGPRQGWLNILYRLSTGAGEDSYLFNIFSMTGVVFAMVLYIYPLVFIVVNAGLNNISSEIEDAANIAGAGAISTMRTITLPLVMPALFAGLILAFLEAMILFGTPAFLAVPARQHVMTTQMRAFMQSEDFLVGLASAYALPMLLAALCLLWMRRKALGRRSYATISGKGGQRRPQKLGRYHWPLFSLFMIPLTCSIGLPYFALIAASLMKTQGYGLTWSNLTLENYYFVLQNDAVWPAIQNTLILATMAATVGALIASLIAYISQRRLVRGSQYLSFLATVPLAIPGIVLAVGLFAAYTHKPLVLYGTLWIIFLAYLTKYLPVAYQTSNAALMSIHPELEESSRILGANRLMVFKDITVPLFKVALVASWILIFLPSLRELSSSVLLWTTNTKVVTVVILNFYEEGRLEYVAVLGVLLMILTIVIVVFSHRIVGRDFMKA
ncbi:MAG: iron ABC transporter permease [Deltaproteobacteria bacterium]|nr:iron ABC transporter permease [Deltaproteobacteria bacterium]